MTGPVVGAVEPGREAPGQTAAATRLVLRPVANPLGLGFVGLAGASATLSVLQLGWIAGDQRLQVGLILLVVAPLPQVLAAVFGFLGRDALAASGMGWLAASWLAYGLITAITPADSFSPALGAYLLVAGTGLLAIAAGSEPEKGVAGVVIALAGGRFLVSGVHEVSGARGWELASGWAGLVLCVLALYAALALALEDARRRPVLPTFRGADGRAMFEEPLASQVQDAAAEAGVRRSL